MSKNFKSYTYLYKVVARIYLSTNPSPGLFRKRVFKLLAVETVAAEEVDVSMAEIAAEDVEEEAGELKEDTDEEVVEEAAAHMKMELTSQMSPVTLKIQIGSHSQTIQGKG